MRLKYLLLILLNLYCPQALSMAFLPLVPGLIGLVASAGLIIDQRMRDRYQKKRFDSIDIKIGDLTTAQNTLRSLVEQAAQENTEQHTVTRQTMQSSAEQLGTKIVDTSASLKTLIEDAAAKNITMHEATKTHLMQLQQTQERMQQLLRASNKSLAYVLFSLMKLTDDNEQLKKHNLELKVEEIHQYGNSFAYIFAASANARY